MASKSRVLAHVEQAEYLKELARLKSAEAIGDLDVDEILNHPDLVAEEIADQLLVELEREIDMALDEAADYARSMGLAALDEDELDQVEAAAEDEFFLLAIPLLSVAIADVGRRLAASAAAGVSQQTLDALLDSAEGRATLLAPLAGASRRAGAAMVSSVDRGASILAMQLVADDPERAADPTAAAEMRQDGEPRFTWVTVNDGKVCEGDLEFACEPRHMMVATMDQWEELGFPGSPNLKCQERCRCGIEEASQRDIELTPVDAREAIAAGKERATMAWQSGR